MPLLRELGHSPAVENSAGELIVTPPARRAPTQLAKPMTTVTPGQVAEALLAHEHRHRVSPQRTAARGERAGPANQPRALAKSLE